MYKNRNFNVVHPKRSYMADGVVVTLPIDEFPVSDKSLFNDAGWPMSTLGVLDRFSKDHVDEDILKRIAERVEVIEHSEVDDGLTDDQRLMLLRPHWVQTASEFADFQERIYQIRQSMSLSTDKSSDVDVNNSDESKDSETSERSVSSETVTA